MLPKPGRAGSPCYKPGLLHGLEARATGQDRTTGSRQNPYYISDSGPWCTPKNGKEPRHDGAVTAEQAEIV